MNSGFVSPEVFPAGGSRFESGDECRHVRLSAGDFRAVSAANMTKGNTACGR